MTALVASGLMALFLTIVLYGDLKFITNQYSSIWTYMRLTFYFFAIVYFIGVFGLTLAAMVPTI